MDNEDKINTAEIAEETGVDQEDVEVVLQELVGEWIYTHHVIWSEDNHLSEFNDL